MPLTWPVKPPLPVLLLATAGCAFGFAYILKRNYALAVVCVTLFVVLLTEAESPVTIGFTAEHILHRYSLRALAWRDDFGSESYWAVELGRMVAKRGADELWPLVASR